MFVASAVDLLASALPIDHHRVVIRVGRRTVEALVIHVTRPKRGGGGS